MSWQARLLNPVLRHTVRAVVFPRIATPFRMQASALLMAGVERLRPRTVRARVTLVHGPGFKGEWVETGDQPARRVLLYFHGGGYMVMSPRGYRDFTGTLAGMLPARVLAVDYRQGANHPWPAPLADALASYRWLLGEGVAPQDIVLGGDSAGGHLVLSTLLAIRDQGLPMPSGGIAISPWTNLGCDFLSYDANRDTDVVLDTVAVRSNAVFQCQGGDPYSPAISPAFADFTGLPPLLIMASSSEILLDDARAARDRAQEAGVKVDYQEYPDMPHVFPIFHPLLPEAGMALREMARFCQGLRG